MALWRASHEFSHVFYESLGLKLWSEVRRAFGLEPTGTSQFPTHDELRILLYILNDSCQASTIEILLSEFIELNP